MSYEMHCNKSADGRAVMQLANVFVKYAALGGKYSVLAGHREMEDTILNFACHT